MEPLQPLPLARRRGKEPMIRKANRIVRIRRFGPSGRSRISLFLHLKRYLWMISFTDSNKQKYMVQITRNSFHHALLHLLSQQKEPWIPEMTRLKLNVGALRNLMRMKRSWWGRSSDSCSSLQKAQAHSNHHQSPLPLHRLPASVVTGSRLGTSCSTLLQASLGAPRWGLRGALAKRLLESSKPSFHVQVLFKYH